MKTQLTRLSKVISGHTFFTFSAFFAALFIYSSIASAALPRECRKYASSAVKQQKENKRYRCGHWGFEWHTNYRNHYSWCLGTSIWNARKHEGIRAAKLRKCKYKKRVSAYKSAFCSNYARKAIAQNRQNSSRRCKYFGSNWHNNFGIHYNWCKGNSKKKVRQHTSWRARKLSACNLRKGAYARKLRYCRSYALAAIRHNKENLRYRCRFGGTRWHNNYGVHFNWCKGQSYKTSKSHQDGRIRSLRYCRNKGRLASSKRAFCRKYAARAVQQHRVNVRNHCQHRGVEWHSNYKIHYNWCLKNSRNRANRHNNWRNKKLNRWCRRR